jgi:antirestriction protein ArdC
MKVNEIVTNKILEKLKAGVVAWQSPYLCREHGPRNFESGRLYTGVNQILLADPDCPYYLTFNQIQKYGGKIIKGTHSEVAVFWKILQYGKQKENGETEESKVPLLRFYTVFNLKNVEGIDWKKADKFPERSQVEKNDAAEELILQYTDRPEIRNVAEHVAYYSPIMDYINMPRREHIRTDADYYATLFHELAHSTGHSTRLNRKLSGRTGSKDYSKEELIAEITTTFVMNHLGMKQTFDNNVSYLHSWLRALNNDPSMIIQAASAADKAFNYMLKVEAAQEQQTEAQAA